MAQTKGLSELAHFWKKTVGSYVRAKRLAAEKGQKELPGLSRKTISDIENGSVNFSLDTLLVVLSAIRGDISEAFKSHVPKTLHTDHQPWHEMLQIILTSGDETEIRLAQRAIQASYASVERTHLETRHK